MLSIAPTAAQKITIDEVTKPYDAKTRSSGQMDRQLMVLALGVLGVLIIGPAIYLFSTRKKHRPRTGTLGSRGCRRESGWNSGDAISERIKLPPHAARSIG